MDFEGISSFLASAIISCALFTHLKWIGGLIVVFRDCFAILGGGLGLMSHSPRCLRIFSYDLSILDESADPHPSRACWTGEITVYMARAIREPSAIASSIRWGSLQSPIG